jgi:hypothetical protein
MTRSASPTAFEALRRAQVRLLHSRAEGSDGRLTVSNLAREAGISRATTYRAKTFVAQFQTLVAQHRQDVRHPQGSPREQIAALEAEIARLSRAERDEIRALRARVQVFAQHIQALTLLTLEQDRQIAALHAERTRSSARVSVVPLPASVGD